MTKPTLLLFFGYGWAASSPFAYTLQRLTKYCHLGWVKNFNYLKDILDHKTLSNNLLFDKIRNNEVTLDQWYDHATNKAHKLNCPTDLKPLEGFDLDEYIFNPVSIDRYIKYYKTLWNFVEPYGYKAVADFTCFNPENPFRGNNKNCLTKSVVDQLSEHFNLKSICIVRDPVRRALSHYGRNLKLNPQHQPSFLDYIHYFDLQKRLISDSHMVVMEELWEGSKREKQRLSKFLGTPVDDLWPNLYSPDIGHHLTWDLDNTYCPTPCQIDGQSDLIITSDLYYTSKEQCQYIYDKWVKRFGILPRSWGRHIDYTKNLNHDYTEIMPYLVEKYNLDLGVSYG